MRLSTAGRPSEADAIAVIVAALEAGVRLIDTADTYCLDEADRGHNERLIRRALAAWGGHRDGVLVATKAGLRRPDGRWFPDARPKRLRQAAEESCAALGVDALDLFALHAPDPRVPFEDSMGELARLKEDGLIRAVGICNVTLDQLVLAQTIVDVDTVQNEANFFGKKAFTDGLMAYCHTLGIAYLAHRPLGGHGRRSKAAGHKSLLQVAARHGATAPQVALAWLLAMSPALVALVGTTRRESMISSLSSSNITLTDDDLQLLEGRKKWAPKARTELRAATPVQAAEAVMVMGSPASGKTSFVAPYVALGYTRLNRDQVGGRLDGLLPLMREHLAQGRDRFVLDNTYPDKRSRAGVLRVAADHGLPVHAIHIDIQERDALVNACHRMIERCGRLLSPDELKEAGRRDPNMFPPSAIYRYFQRFEPTTAAEGFATVTTVPFERRKEPGADGRALLLDLDGTVRETRGGPPFPVHPDDVHLMPRRKTILQRYVEAGWRLLGVTNQAGAALGQLTEEQVQACCDRTADLLGLPIDISYCPHPAGAIKCWCRKPLPGMGVAFLRKYALDPDRCLMVGDRPSDEAFARNLGVPFRWADDFFSSSNLGGGGGP
jgi:histidinol-phosphate phosphatase family protein